MNQEGGTSVIEIRKDKLRNLLRGKWINLIFYILLIAVIWIGIYVRSANLDFYREGFLPTDPDSALFFRYMKEIVETGNLEKIDTMRYVPFGFDTLAESRFFPYVLAYLYNIIKIFDSDVTLLRVDILYPIIFFALAVIAFFFLVKKLFDIRIALVATAFLAVVPTFLQRTMPGFSDKEPLGTLLFFTAFYFLVTAWQEKRIKWVATYGAIAGLFTGLLGLTWGGVSFAILIIAFTFLIAFILGKFSKRIFALYAAWLIVTFVIMSLFTNKYGRVYGNLISVEGSLSVLVLASMLLYFGFQKLRFPLKEKLPLQFITLITAVILGILVMTVTFGFNYIINKLEEIQLSLLYPFGVLRLTLTVAENNQPFFTTMLGSFGLMFWLFILGTILIFYVAIEHFSSRVRYTLFVAYAFFIVGLLFSRYDSGSVLNGTNTISQALFFGSFFVLLVVTLYVYLGSFKSKEFEKFSGIKFEYLLTIIWAVWLTIGARGAIRLFFIYAPITAILAGFFLIKLVDYGWKFDKVIRVFAVIVVSLIAVFIFYSYAKASYNSVNFSSPHLGTQWMNAMSWVKSNTPEEAVFSHWWDYGYWIQTAGERATVLDGGNVYPYWDYLMGRYVLTAHSEQEALEFLYTHNATYLLIDPTDIGKYPAYSLIGSDEEFDRYSWIHFFHLDQSQTRETRNGTLYVYLGGTPLDEDFMWQGKLFPAEAAGIGGFLVPVSEQNGELNFGQPTALVVYGGEQYNIPLECIFLDREIKFNEQGLEGCLLILPKITQQSINKLDTAAYISAKSRKTLWVNLYLFQKKSQYFELVHSEDDPIIADIKSRITVEIPGTAEVEGYGLRAPIKIWKINYPIGMQVNETFLETDYPNEKLALPRGFQ
ncbi:MAG: STT3 domain-containing protein [Nanoarchaeota archaeon]